MTVKTVSGKVKKHNVNLVTISTCIWCIRLKAKLNNKSIQYSYTDIDVLPSDEKEELKNKLRNTLPQLAFPMMFVDGTYIPNDDIDDKIQDLVQDG
jgi:DNA phosphorothioation-dependent restriction protein DptG